MGFYWSYTLLLELPVLMRCSQMYVMLRAHMISSAAEQASNLGVSFQLNFQLNQE